MNNTLLLKEEEPTLEWKESQIEETLDLQKILQVCRSRVNIIREEPWPLIHYSTDNSLFQTFSEKYQVSDFIIKETIDIIKSFGFVEWRELSFDEDSKKVVESSEKKFLEDILWNRKEESIEEVEKQLDIFLKKLSKNPVVQEMYNSWIKESEIPYGLFRFISLFDMKTDTFSNISEFFDFLLINIEEQEDIFWESYLDSISKNWWFPVDDVSHKKELLRTGNYNIDLWEVELFWEKLPIFIRIVPGYAPPWLEIEIWFDIDWNTTNNIAYIWIKFEKNKNWKSTWVIHTIQYGMYNIWFKDWKIIPISSSNTEDTLKSKEKKKVIYGVWKEFVNEKKDPNAVRFLLALSCNMLFTSWYKDIEVINPVENIWLSAHNPNRDEESIKKSGYNQYIDNAINIWWELQENWRTKIDELKLQEYLVLNIKSNILENFSQNVWKFSDLSDFFKSLLPIENIDELTDESKNKVANIINNIKDKVRIERELQK